MIHRRLLMIVLCAVVAMSVTVVQAEEIKLKQDGLTLNGNLRLAPGKRIADGVILMTHGGLAHYGMHTISNLQQLFSDAGYSTLAINLSLGLDNRHGMYDCKIPHRHRQQDAIGEIDAWMGWLHERGVTSVTLLGHSRGGAQTAWYAMERKPKLANAVVLLAPATADNGGKGYQQRYGQPLEPVLSRARALVDAGNGKTLVPHANMMFCRDTSVSAESFVSYYGPNPRLDTPWLLPRIDKPVLVVVAGQDDTVVGLDKKIQPLLGHGKLEMTVVDGANHAFQDLFGDDVVAAVDAFLKKRVGRQFSPGSQ